jgi:hypothetical protein
VRGRHRNTVVVPPAVVARLVGRELRLEATEQAQHAEHRDREQRQVHEQERQQGAPG